LVAGVLVTALLGASVALAGCDNTDNADTPARALVEGSGVVRFVSIEGGCWLITADDGTSYHPLRLDEPYRRDGLRVRFSGRPRTDVAGFCPGTPIELRSIAIVGG